MSAADLDSRVAALLLRTRADPDQIAALVAEAETALVSAERDLGAAREKAINPLTSAREVPEHRGRSFELQFMVERLQAGLEHLRLKHEEAVAQVERERREAERAEITAERDAAAAKLSETYQRAAREIADVLDAVVQVNRRVAGWNAQAAGSRIDGLPDLYRGVRLPAERAGEVAFWPPLDRIDPDALVPVEMAKFSEARAAEAKEAAEARAVWEKAARLHPQRRRVPV